VRHGPKPSTLVGWRGPIRRLGLGRTSLQPHDRFRLPQRLADAIHTWVDLFMFKSTQDLLQFLRENGLTMAHYSLFMKIDKVGSCGVTEIASLLDVSKPAARCVTWPSVAESTFQIKRDFIGLLAAEIVTP
jgi:hypothetical protein